jgi:hypothetical protein
VVVAAVAACGGNGDVAPPPPPIVTIIAGDNQSAPAGYPLSLALRVSVTTAEGVPAVGEAVTWAVVKGGGRLSSNSGVTDTEGMAAVNWRLGNLVGTQSVTAAVSRVSVQFSATARPGPSEPAALHFDGSQWTVSMLTFFNNPLSLRSVWGSSASSVFAVGSLCGFLYFARYDGADWTLAQLDCPGGFGGGGLASVWGKSATDVFAVGTEGSAFSNEPIVVVFHFDGNHWNYQYRQQCACARLNGVWSSSATDAVAVGDSGVVLHFDGATWIREPARSVSTNLKAVWGTRVGGSNRIFAVGDLGTIIFFDGSSWLAQSSGTTAPLYGVWGSSESNVFAVGVAGTLLHYDGTSWSAITTGSTRTLRGVWGASANSIYAVGDGATIIHSDGTSVTTQVLSAPIDLYGVWGSSATNVFAVGDFFATPNLGEGLAESFRH